MEERLEVSVPKPSKAKPRAKPSVKGVLTWQEKAKPIGPSQNPPLRHTNFLWGGLSRKPAPPGKKLLPSPPHPVIYINTRVPPVPKAKLHKLPLKPKFLPKPKTFPVNPPDSSVPHPIAPPLTREE